jgi:hypothetical protein
MSLLWLRAARGESRAEIPRHGARLRFRGRSLPLAQAGGRAGRHQSEYERMTARAAARAAACSMGSPLQVVGKQGQGQGQGGSWAGGGRTHGGCPSHAARDRHLCATGICALYRPYLAIPPRPTNTSTRSQMTDSRGPVGGAQQVGAHRATASVLRSRCPERAARHPSSARRAPRWMWTPGWGKLQRAAAGDVPCELPASSLPLAQRGAGGLWPGAPARAALCDTHSMSCPQHELSAA